MEKPILFNTDMVRAILDGRKTETRRPIKPKYKNDEHGFQVCTNKSTGEQWVEKMDDDEGGFNTPRYVNPPYQVGDILYVRETWADTWTPGQEKGFVYKADGEPPNFPYWGNESTCKDNVWRPSIHMPKEAARIFLKVTDVRAERLQDITEEMAMAEGIRGWTKDGNLYKYGHIEPGDYGSTPWANMPRTAVEAYRNLWDCVYKNWSENPWVWVIKFEIKN